MHGASLVCSLVGVLAVPVGLGEVLLADLGLFGVHMLNGFYATVYISKPANSR